MGTQLMMQPGDGSAGAFAHLFLTFGPEVRPVLLRQAADEGGAEEFAGKTAFTTRLTHDCVDKRNCLAPIRRAARHRGAHPVRKRIIRGQSGDFPPAGKAGEGAALPPSCIWTRLECGPATSGRSPQRLQRCGWSYIDGVSQGETAANLEIPLGTVRSRMHFAFGRLRGSAERSL